jgi:hypothetical protein
VLSTTYGQGDGNGPRFGHVCAARATVVVVDVLVVLVVVVAGTVLVVVVVGILVVVVGTLVVVVGTLVVVVVVGTLVVVVVVGALTVVVGDLVTVRNEHLYLPRPGHLMTWLPHARHRERQLILRSRQTLPFTNSCPHLCALPSV